MFDNPKPEDALRTTVGDWDKHGRQQYNRGIKDAIEAVKVRLGDLERKRVVEATRVDKLVNGEWEEVVYWDHAEWEERGTEAFEAIIGCITRIANDEVVEVPLPDRSSLPSGDE